jgi:hypothetical protein
MEFAFSFPVRLFHPLQHAGLSRRTLKRVSRRHPFGKPRPPIGGDFRDAVFLVLLKARSAPAQPQPGPRLSVSFRRSLNRLSGGSRRLSFFGHVSYCIESTFSCLSLSTERMWCPEDKLMDDYSHILFNKTPQQLRLIGLRLPPPYLHPLLPARALPKTLPCSTPGFPGSGVPKSARARVAAPPTAWLKRGPREHWHPATPDQVLAAVKVEPGSAVLVQR